MGLALNQKQQTELFARIARPGGSKDSFNYLEYSTQRKLTAERMASLERHLKSAGLTTKGISLEILNVPASPEPTPQVSFGLDIEGRSSDSPTGTSIEGQSRCTHPVFFKTLC